MKNKKKDFKITFRLNQEQYNDLIKIADVNNLSISALLRKIIDMVLNNWR